MFFTDADAAAAGSRDEGGKGAERGEASRGYDMRKGCAMQRLVLAVLFLGVPACKCAGCCGQRCGALQSSSESSQFMRRATVTCAT
jgi:hypothetical protein